MVTHYTFVWTKKEKDCQSATNCPLLTLNPPASHQLNYLVAHVYKCLEILQLVSPLTSTRILCFRPTFTSEHNCVVLPPTDWSLHQPRWLPHRITILILYLCAAQFQVRYYTIIIRTPLCITSGTHWLLSLMNSAEPPLYK